MSALKLVELNAEIESELKALGETASGVSETLSTLPCVQPQKRIYLQSLALCLHNFYTGCERIFQRIAEELNGGVPKSGDWHHRLLQRMTNEVPGIRPAVISMITASSLRDYLSFRHVVRNIYGFELEEGRLLALAKNLPESYRAFRTDLAVFQEFLKVAG